MKLKTLYLTVGIFLLTSSLFAQEYLVSGTNISGQARVTPTSTGMIQAVKVRLYWEAFERKGGVQFLQGRGTIDHRSGTLSWEYTENRRGITRALDRLLGRDRKPKKITVTMKKIGPNQYRGVVKGKTLTWTLRPDPKQYSVLIVPGLGTNSWNKIGVPYLVENGQALKAMGYSARRLKISTESSVATNAAHICKQVLAEGAKGKKVILFAHSKGATDTTAALALYPDIRKHVAGVIAVQPVYRGSPVADLVGNQPILEGTVKILFENIFRGEKEAVIDLTHSSRRAFVRRNPYPADKIPTVVIRSTFDRWISMSILWPNEKLISMIVKKPNDGMVTLADQVIPGAKVTITLQDLDHFEPGVRGESPHTPQKITHRAMIQLLPHLEKNSSGTNR